MAAWVLLKHVLPDGAWHWDWMLEASASPDGGLVTFRIASTVEWPPRGAFEAEQLSTHRREYLTYEGPISGGRGSVTRADGGGCRLVNVAADAMVVEIDSDDPERRSGSRLRLRGTALRGGQSDRRWRFDLEFP